ncbi:MAG: glycosyltransferase [Propionibacteriaceae bacterium]|jgi:glycosyltransferase involved in cell wall biosynthesis|nr:glycosyltransferase [Propionibacteriaceae bacterium]
MSDISISILVPIFNVERYLDQALASIAAQTFTDIEVLCINDGSTDGSRDIIQHYLDTDPRFRVIDKANSGYGASMNLGLSQARGEYIGIVESDDFIDPTMFEVLHDAATRFSAQVAKANFLFYWSKPYPKDQFEELYPPSMCNRVINPQTEHDIFYLKPSIWSGLYLKSFLDDNDVRFLETPGASYQDFGFSTKGWISADRIVLIHEAYLHYRQDNEQSSVNNPGKVYCVNDEYEAAEAYLTDRPAKAAYLRPVLTKMKYDSYMWNLERIAPQFRPEFVARMQEEFRAEAQAGTIDWDLFEPWKKAALQKLLRSQEDFLITQEAGGHHGYVAKALHYLKSGGPAMLARIVKNKLMKKG